MRGDSLSHHSKHHPLLPPGSLTGNSQKINHAMKIVTKRAAHLQDKPLLNVRSEEKVIRADGSICGTCAQPPCLLRG